MTKNREETRGQGDPPSPIKKMKFGPAATGPGEGKGGTGKEKTAPIPRGGSGGGLVHDDDPFMESATDAIDPEEIEDPRASFEARGQGSGPSETEELFVILPEEESGQLPVVETMVVEEQPWESGPSATEMLKEILPDLSSDETSTGQSLEDVPLMKENPLSGSTRSGGRDADTEDLGIARDDEIKVIEEIADIAADLESDEPSPEPEEEAPLRRAPALPSRAELAAAPDGKSRKRWIIMGSAIAALVLAGVFFYSDLQKLFMRQTGGGGERGPKVAQAITPKGQDPAATVAGPREEFRAKIHRAMQLGLRGEAGKE